MNASVMGRFLAGDAEAIRDVARSRSALWTGIVLVLLTAIARNYDQDFIGESAFWLIGPLLFSFFSGSFLYWVVIRRFATKHFETETRGGWTTFMGLFWMTAPTAWLYAIPVERFLDSYSAAQANLTLLAVVSAWRVLLMSRVVSVLLRISFPRALGWTMVAACLEVLIVMVLGIFSNFSERIMASMGGMRNAPEENLILNALSTVWWCSWIVLALVAAILNVRRFEGTTQPLPARSSSNRMPWITLAILAAFWIGIAIPAQKEQYRFVTHAKLVEQEDYRGALAYLERHERSAFPAGRRLEPNPYEYRVWEALPPTVALLNSNTPSWIRRVYLSHLEATLSHFHYNYRSITNAAAMFSAVEELPEGPEWFQANQTALARGFSRYSRPPETEAVELAAFTNLLGTLQRMRVTETSREPPG